MVEMKPQGALAIETLVHDGEPKLQPGDVRLHRRPTVFIDDAARRTKATFVRACRERRPDVEGGIEVRKLGRGWLYVTAKIRRVALDNERNGLGHGGKPEDRILPGTKGAASARAKSSSLSFDETTTSVIQGRRGPIGSQPDAISSGEQVDRT
jgi:hypothetical protein